MYIQYCCYSHVVRCIYLIAGNVCRLHMIEVTADCILFNGIIAHTEW